MGGSLDYIADALDSLNKDNCMYLLVVRRLNENCIRAYSELMGSYNKEMIAMLIHAGNVCLIDEAKENEGLSAQD